jgi:hypothetical protein
MWGRNSAVARLFSVSAKASDFLPKSTNPTILRLLDSDPIALKMSTGTLVYPRRRLNFSSRDSFKEIYRETQESIDQEGSYRYQYTLGYIPATAMGLAMFMRLDPTIWSHWVYQFLLLGIGYYYHMQIRSQKSKIVRHLLISPNYSEIIIGLDNLKGKESSEVLPADVAPMKGLIYQKVNLEHILFFGYHQTYRRVQEGLLLQQAEKEVSQKIQEIRENPHLGAKLLKGLSNKEKLLITVVFYDAASNKYKEGTINPNYNQLEECEDYLMNLVHKQNMKFFSSQTAPAA